MSLGPILGPGAGLPPAGLAPAVVARQEPAAEPAPAGQASDLWSALFVFVLATFIGLGVIRRVSRLLHTPLMSITNAISAIAVVGSITVFSSMTNIVCGFLISDRILKMFKTEDRRREGPRP